MSLNTQKGDMYGFVTHTWNAIKGKCLHDCVYCYMKRFPQKELRFDEKELKTQLSKGDERNHIFVGSSTDMFAENVPSEWIIKVLEHCNEYPLNTYLFQSKNPIRFKEFVSYFPPNKIIGTTIETNHNMCDSAPEPFQRSKDMFELRDIIASSKMVTLEPLYDFDLFELVAFVKMCNPDFVNIGADSNTVKNYRLFEPSSEQVNDLIKELKKFTKVNLKSNLSRIHKGDGLR